jgi:1-acyl-sn-glycerol-3-phosphate acyltransferase
MSGRGGGTVPSSAPPEGLAWLGHEPSPRVPLLLRLTAALTRFVAYRMARVTLRIEGRENRPAAPFIIAAAIHRSWLDALVLVEVFPLEPRIWFIASGPAAFRTPLRAMFIRALGGVLPVYRGGYSIDSSVESARAVLRAGAVLGLFPEGSRKGPADALQRFRGGVGYLALRTGVPVVPIALAGTKELYLGKRLAVRILPPIDPLRFADLDRPPAVGSREEREAANRVTAGLRDLLEPHVLELVAWTTDPPNVPRRLSWFSRLFP